MRIVISGPNRLYAEGVARLLRQGDSADARDIVAFAASEPEQERWADIVVVRHGGGPAEFEESMRAVAARYAAAQLVVTGVARTPQMFAACLRLGVAAWLCAEDGEERLIEALRRVVDGEHSVSPHAGPARPPTKDGRSGPDVRLTPRQIMIVAAISEGLSNREIGERLEIKTQTVKNHVHGILEKLGLESRLQLAQYALGTAPSGPARDLERREARF